MTYDPAAARQALKAAGLNDIQVQAALAAADATVVATEATEARREFATGVAAGKALGHRIKGLRDSRSRAGDASDNPASADASRSIDDAHIQDAAAAAAAATVDRAAAKALVERKRSLQGEGYRSRLD